MENVKRMVIHLFKPIDAKKNEVSTVLFNQKIKRLTAQLNLNTWVDPVQPS